MSVQKGMKAISFRLPRETIKELKKHVQHTRWVQALVLKHLGYCAACGQSIKKEPTPDDK